MIQCPSIFVIILVETIVSIVTIHVGVKIFILQESLGKRTLRYSGAILFNSLPETYKRAASLEAFERLLMKHDFA